VKDAMTFWTWEWILQEVQKIQVLRSGYRDNIYPGMPLPPVYAQSVGGLGALLVDLIQRLGAHTKALLPSRPGFRAKWDVKYFQRLQSMAYAPRRNDGSNLIIDLYSTDPLEFCLISLAGTLIMLSNSEVDGDRNCDWEYSLHEPSELFAILDDHLSNATKHGKKEDIARLDEVLYNSYSDLSALYQMLFIVRLHQPRVPVRTLEDAIKTETGRAWRYTKAGYLDQDHRVSDHSKNTENMDDKIKAQQTLGSLLGEFLGTTNPTGSKASHKWLDQDQTQRSASSRLWAQMRSRHRQTLERLRIGNDDLEADLRVLSADLTPEHISSIERERAEILARIAAKETQKTTRKQPSEAEIQTRWGNSPAEVSVPAPEPKIKVKTRSNKPAEQLDLGLTDLEISDNNEEPPPVKVAVSKRTLEILQSLYPKPNLEERTKNVAWASFLYAMAEVGFAARQIHGSMYSFEPNPTCKWYGRGRIIFHKPHPEPKYEAWKLLGIGKRMTKWFDWNADTFELLEVRSEV
jgi:hypothetical protein